MRLLKKIGIIFLKIILGVVIFLILWICAVFLLPQIKVNKNFTTCNNDDCITVYIRSNGMHSDFVFPVKTKERDWLAWFPREIYEGVDSTYNFVSIGWGDKGFYLDTPTWADLKVSTALKATIGVSGSAMHIIYFQNPPVNDGEKGRLLKISSKQYQKILHYIDNSFLLDDNGKIILIKHPDFDINDNYYEAKGSYSLFKTCNVWTGKCLKQAGIQIGIWTPTAASVMSSIP